MDICIRGVSPSIVRALDEAAAKQGTSREEYLRRCLSRLSFDERIMEGRYADQLQKLITCIRAQQGQLNEITRQLDELIDWSSLQAYAQAQEEEPEFGYPEEGEGDGNGYA